jgi:hypothetical protein
MAQEERHRAQVLGSSTDQRRLGAYGMGPVRGRIETNFPRPRNLQSGGTVEEHLEAQDEVLRRLLDHVELRSE